MQRLQHSILAIACCSRVVSRTICPRRKSPACSIFVARFTSIAVSIPSSPSSGLCSRTAASNARFRSQSAFYILRKRRLARPFNESMSETNAGPVLATVIVRVNHDTHLSAEDIAALVDGRVSPAHRRELDTHLGICSECRHEVVAASRIVESSVALRARRRRWTTVGIGLAAAATILIAVLPRLQPTAIQRGEKQERGAAPRAAMLATVSP